MNNIKQIPSKTKNHLIQHRAKYGFAAGAIAMFAIHRGAVKEWNEFLAEENLTDKFYLPEN